MMPGEIPDSDTLTRAAFRCRREGRYAAHPVEAALRYHRSQAEESGEESHGVLDFESAESLYRQGAQGIRLSEAPQLARSIPELSRLGAVDHAARTHLRRWVEAHGPVYEESRFVAAWEAQDRRGGAEHHVHHDQEEGRWFKRLHRSLHYTTLGDYFDRMRLHDENVVRLEGTDALVVIDPFICLARRGTWAALKLSEIGLPEPPDDLLPPETSYA